MEEVSLSLGLKAPFVPFGNTIGRNRIRRSSVRFRASRFDGIATGCYIESERCKFVACRNPAELPQTKKYMVV